MGREGMIYLSGKDKELLELIAVFLKNKGYNFEVVSMDSLFDRCQKNKPRVVFLEVDSEACVDYVQKLKNGFSGVDIILAATPFWCKTSKFDGNGEKSIRILIKPFLIKTLIEEIDKRLQRKEVEA